MTDLFLKVLEMSVMGSVVILVTLLTRFLMRKRSKRFIMILWAVVAVRLLIPLNIGSVFSIFNYIPLNTDVIASQVQEAENAVFKAKTAATEKEAAADIQDEAVVFDELKNENVPDAVQTVTMHPLADTAAALQIKTVLACVWLAGVIAVAAYSVIRFTALKIRLKNAVKSGRNVYVSDKVSAPFVFGLIVPKIYLPEVLSDREREFVLMHERTHIRRGDWIRKVIGMAVVAIHWFNPLAWLAFFLFGQDIEMSCDETAVKDMDAERKQAYAVSIVNFARRSNSRKYLVTQLGFSSNDFGRREVAHRVKNIISYRKGTKITTAFMTLVMLLLAVSLGLNSKPVLAAEDIMTFEKIEAPAKHEAPFDYVTAEPASEKVSDNEKKISFYRDGKEISGKLCLPVGDGPFKTIVLCGIVDGPAYDKTVRYFTESGYAVVMFEPNITMEDYTAPAPNSGMIFHYILDLYAVMDELRYLSDVDLSNVYLWGHQTGGTVAAYAGTERQAEIKGMVLVEPEFEEYTFSEEPKLVVNIYDILPNCSVPATVVWGTLHPSTRPAQKAADLLQNGRLTVLDGNSYSRTFEDDYADRTAEETIKAFNSCN